jgi:hypothetical protein
VINNQEDGTVIQLSDNCDIMATGQAINDLANEELNEELSDTLGKHTDNETASSIRHVHANVIETLFSALPTEPLDRKREQERRRKYKDKLQVEHPGKLIVDSSYVNNEGKEEKQYTNAIIVTDEIDWW